MSATAAETRDAHEQTFRRLLRERFGVDGEIDAEVPGGAEVPSGAEGMARRAEGIGRRAPPLPDDGVLVAATHHRALAAALKAAGWRLYVTCVATHFPAAPGKKPGDAETPEHFEVATVLRTLGTGTHVARWRVSLATAEPLDSLVHIFAGADWQEREQFDLVGVVFTGHPDLRRLMMPDEWVGHPLRRDYAIDTPHAPWR